MILNFYMWNPKARCYEFEYSEDCEGNFEVSGLHDFLIDSMKYFKGVLYVMRRRR